MLSTVNFIILFAIGYVLFRKKERSDCFDLESELLSSIDDWLEMNPETSVLDSEYATKLVYDLIEVLDRKLYFVSQKSDYDTEEVLDIISLLTELEELLDDDDGDDDPPPGEEKTPDMSGVSLYISFGL